MEIEQFEKIYNIKKQLNVSSKKGRVVLSNDYAKGIGHNKNF